MKIKGIILAGGTGSRLFPITNVISKQLLPIYDKPMIYYPLSILMLAGIKEIAIIVKPNNLEAYKAFLGDGSQLGISINYFVQEKPNGLPEAFNITANFIKNHKVCMILGDNIFYGSDFINKYLRPTIKKNGSSIFLYSVHDPSRFGIVEFDKNNKIKNIIEKPKRTNSNFAITGLYFFDEKVSSFSRNLKPSKRGETEIIDLLNIYATRRGNRITMEETYLVAPGRLMTAAAYFGHQQRLLQQRQGGKKLKRKKRRRKSRRKKKNIRKKRKTKRKRLKRVRRKRFVKR